MNSPLLARFSFSVLVLAFLSLTLTNVNKCLAFSSDDPAVIAMVNKGIEFLERSDKMPTHYATDMAYKGGLGEWAICGYAHFKIVHDPNHPVVRRGVEAARMIARKAPSEKIPDGGYNKSVYATAVATLLLAEVDRVAFQGELKTLGQFLKKVQFGNGSFGYFGSNTGDVSQVQYAMLALWTLDNAGVPIDYSMITQASSWMLRVQDPSGGWPYQGKDPGSAKRVKQNGLTASMAVAGGSAILIGGDALKLWGMGKSLDDPGVKGLPESVKLFVEGMVNRAVKRPEVPSEPIINAIKDCDRWLQTSSPNPGKLKSAYPYYQLYTVERYESFREVALKLEKNYSPAWFNDGVTYLKSLQKADGGWPGGSHTNERVSTAFSILFLSRSTQKAIEATQEGTLAGGFGLPGDTTKITVDGTQIKGEPVAGAVTDLLDMLEGDDPDALEGKSIPEDMELATEPKARRVQIERLERLVRGSSSWQARRVAARLLGASDEIKVVPSLIFALDDPDTVVRTFARDGLRFISRKFEGFGMEIQPGAKQDYGELRKAQRLWREWYLTMDPGYIFIAE